MSTLNFTKLYRKGKIMPSNKPRIATYTTHENIRKFKIISAYKNKSMSDYLAELIDTTIKNYEAEHGEIKIDLDPKN